MSTSFIHIALLKKELRQLAPLVFGVLLLALVGFVMIEAQPTSWRSNTYSTGYLLLAIPTFFAVGAGAISVSQEKETRTLGWLSSLPLSRDRLVKTKFMSAILVWALLWMVTIASILFIDFIGFDNPFPEETIDTHPIYSPRLAYWVTHAFYLLVCSFLTAWWLGSSMTSLVAFLPLAFAPSLVRFAIAYVQNPFHPIGSSVYDATLTQLFASLAISLPIALWCLRVYSGRALQPAESKFPRNPYALGSSLTDVRKRSSQSVFDPTTALLWQFVFQNKTFLISILAASGISGLIALAASRTWGQAQRLEVEPFVFLMVALCVSWMGVLAFQGDNLQERIRFLSDRGVKPSRVWWTRLLMPLSFAASVSLFYALLRSLWASEIPSYPYAPVWAVFTFCVIVIGYSQWISQLIRHPILGAIGAPAISSMACVYLAYCYGFIGSSALPLMLISCVPFLATYLTMSRWMDRRSDRVFWFSHVVLFLLSVLAPLVELGWYVARFPNMPRAMQAGLREELKSLRAMETNQPNKTATRWIPLEQLSEQTFAGWGDWTAAQRLVLANSMDDSEALLKELKRRGADKYSPIADIVLNLSDVSARVLLSRFAVLDGDGSKELLTDYRNNVELLFEIAKSLRSSRFSRSQQVADLHEIALLVELLQPSAREHLDPKAFRNYVLFLSDRDSRNQARREALIASWAKFDLSDQHYHETEYLLRDWYLAEISAKPMLTARQQVNHLVKVLLEFLGAGPTATEEQKIKFLEERVASPINSRGERSANVSRINDPIVDELQPIGSGMLGDQWFAGWEQVAFDLKKSLD